ncbi:transporter [Sulfolobus sp. F1]|nr:transporter [Sulfolobus sp. F1]
MISLIKVSLKLNRISYNPVLFILSYSIPTFVLVYPSFFIPMLAKHFPYWEAFLLLSLPFLGRVFGSVLYQFFRSYTIPFILLSLLTFLQSNLLLIFPVRFLIGVLFGLLTSYAVDNAVKSSNNLILGLTTGGWSIGWVLSYIAYQFLHSFYEINLFASVLILSLSFLGIGQPLKVLKARVNFSFPKVSSVLIYLSVLTPAFALEVIPSILEKINLTWLILPAYVLSIIAYLGLPIIGQRMGIRKCVIVTMIVMLLSGLSTFLLYPYMLLPFTIFGLGILSIVPKYLDLRGEKSERLGMALNIGSIAGIAIPTLYSLFPITPESFLIASSLMIFIL